MALKSTVRPIETDKKTSFPILLEYYDNPGYVMVNTALEIRSGKSFKVVETNFGS